MEFDHEKGVWIGSMARSRDDFTFPSPLYLFGYGRFIWLENKSSFCSLCWKPEPLLQGQPTHLALIKGFKRRFCQKSTDHRGTPNSPGVVCTLMVFIKSFYLKIKNMKNRK